MTLDEKAGQLNQSSGIVMPGIADTRPDALITKGKVGSILWLTNVKEINRLQHLAVEQSRLHIPIMFRFDDGRDSGEVLARHGAEAILH